MTAAATIRELEELSGDYARHGVEWREAMKVMDALPSMLSYIRALEAVADEAKYVREVRSSGRVPRQVNEGEAWTRMCDALDDLKATESSHV